MNFYWTGTIFTVIALVTFIGFIVGLIIVIKLIINYNTAQKNTKSRQQQELDKMNLDDLN